MPTDMQYDNRMMMRDQEEIARRKKAAMNPNGIPGAVAGGMVGGASGGVAANPQVAARPYAPPLTVQEITQKFMGGPASVPTGIPQQSAQNPAPQAAPAKPLGPTFNGQTEQQRAQARLSPQQGLQARAGIMDAQDAFKNAWDDGAVGMPIGRSRMSSADRGRLRADIGLAREDAAGYDAQQAGAPGPAFTAERTEAGRKRLQEQAARIAAERNGQPLPGSTDTWSYEAGQKALPKELQGQVFTHPQDQANYRDFSRFVGGAPSIDPVTGQMTSPADREYKSVQQLREEEIMARRKAAQPIDFAPFDPAEAEQNQRAATERYNDTIARGNSARAQRTQSAELDRTLADAPSREAAAKSEAMINEQRRAAAAASAATGLIPGQTELANAENRSKTTDANYKTANAGTMSLRDQAKANEERIRAETAAKVAPRRSDAELRGIEADAGLKEAQTGIQRKQLERYDRPGGPLDTITMGEDAANAAARRNAAKAITGVDPLTISEKIIPRLASISSLFGGSRLYGKTGAVQDKTFGDMGKELGDLKQIMGMGIGPLTDYARHDPAGAKDVARGILANLPPPNSEGKYEASRVLLGSPQMDEYVQLLNQLRASLEAMAK